MIWQWFLKNRMITKRNYSTPLFLFILALSFLSAASFRFNLGVIPVVFPVFPLLILYFLCETTKKKIFLGLRMAIFSLIALLTIGLVVSLLISMRHFSAPEFYIHDGALQAEEAIKYFLNGKNPYAEDYLGTPLIRWGYTAMAGEPNPALFHFTYLPFLFLFALPFYLSGIFLIGWFDIRFVFCFCFIGSLYLLYKIVKSERNRLLFLIIFAFNPIFVLDLVEGYNDVFILFWLLLTIYFLKRGRITLSAVPLGLALASKQTAWFILPFYFIFVSRQVKPKRLIPLVLGVAKKCWPLFAACLLFILPFLLWNTRSFIGDTYQYLDGSLSTSYPIRGMGFSSWLVSLGIIKSALGNYPFWLFQVIFSLPVLVFLVKKQLRENSLARMVINYAIFLSVFWFFSRFFNYSYPGCLSQLLLIGAALDS